MKVFITGGKGFLGSHISKELQKYNTKVIVYDNKGGPNQTDGEDYLQIHGSIVDFTTLLEAIKKTKPHIIIHLAALVSSFRDPSLNVRVNLEGTVNVLEAMRLSGVDKGIHISSEEVYGEFSKPVIKESHTRNPVSPYGITKMAAENYVQYYNNNYSMDLINIRTSWVYGAGYPRNRPDLDLVSNVFNGQKTVLDTGRDHLLDLTYIDDFVSGLVKLMFSSNLEHDTYNLSSGKVVSFSHFIETLNKVAPTNNLVDIGSGLLKYSYNNSYMPQKGALDINRLKKEVGYQPKTSLEDGLRMYIKHLEENNYSG